MIVGISMGLVETCQTLLEEKPPDGYMWSGEENDEKTAHIQARSSMARALEVNGKTRQAEGKAKVV